MKILNKLLILFMITMILSCGKETSSGFGSETSTGIVVGFHSDELPPESQVVFSVYDKDAAPNESGDVKSLYKDTVLVSDLDTINLPQGEYSIVSKGLNSDKVSISSEVVVEKDSLTVVLDSLAEPGVILFTYDKALRESELSLFITGTEIRKSLSESKEYDNDKQFVELTNIPAGVYENIMLYDERTSDWTVPVSNAFTLSPGDTITLEALKSNWPIKKPGVILFTYDNTLRESDLSLLITGTEARKSLYYSKEYDSNKKLVELMGIPAGDYANIMIYDERTADWTVAVSNGFTLPPGDTVTVDAISNNWPIPDKEDGFLTANWYYDVEMMDSVSGLVDTVMTTLYPKAYSPLLKKSAITPQIHLSIGGAFTFSSIPYGNYNVISKGALSGYTISKSVTLSNNQNLIISDTLHSPITLQVDIQESLITDETVCYLAGSDLLQETSGATNSSQSGFKSLYFKVPLGLESRVMVVNKSNPTDIIVESNLITYVNDTAISLQ